jgi:hypothetical protein
MSATQRTEERFPRCWQAYGKSPPFPCGRSIEHGAARRSQAASAAGDPVALNNLGAMHEQVRSIQCTTMVCCVM